MLTRIWSLLKEAVLGFINGDRNPVSVGKSLIGWYFGLQVRSPPPTAQGRADPDLALGLLLLAHLPVRRRNHARLFDHATAAIENRPANLQPSIDLPP